MHLVEPELVIFLAVVQLFVGFGIGFRWGVSYVLKGQSAQRQGKVE